MNHDIKFMILSLFFIAQACSSNNQTLELTPAVPTSTATIKPHHTLELTPAVPTSTATSKPHHIESGRFEFEDLEREYLLFIPESYSESEEYPLVIYLHSRGFTAEHNMDRTQLNPVADRNDFLVVYPRAINLVWNSGNGDRIGRSTPDVNDVGFIDALIDILSTNYSIDPDRIYVAGWSNGGFMAYKLACQLSHRIAAIASVAGVLSDSTLAECNPLRPVPILHIHGTTDKWVPIDGCEGWNSVDQTLSYWVAFNDCSKTITTKLKDLDTTDYLTVEKTSYFDCTNNSSVIFYKRIGGGHGWPSAVHGLVASEEVWNFFKDYRLTPKSTEN